MKNYFLVLLIAMMFYSCATMQAPSDKIDMDAMELRIGVEMSDMLFTLYDTEILTTTSSTRSTDYTNKEQITTTTTTSKDTPKHPLGIYIGNNLFMDLNGNISLSILDFFGLRDKDSWEIEYRAFGSMNKVLAKKSGNKINYSKVKKGAKAYMVVEAIDHTLYRKSGFLKESVTFNNDEYNYSSNMGILLRDANLRQVENNKIDFNGRIVTLTDNQVTLLSKNGKYAESRIINYNGVVEVYKTITNFVFFKKEKLVATISRTPTGITVKKNMSFGMVSTKHFKINDDYISIKPSFLEFYYSIK